MPVFSLACRRQSIAKQEQAFQFGRVNLALPLGFSDFSMKMGNYMDPVRGKAGSDFFANRSRFLVSNHRIFPRLNPQLFSYPASLARFARAVLPLFLAFSSIP